ncbi:MAG: hypothetical protein RR374_04505 [Clostridia bacterium]
MSLEALLTYQEKDRELYILENELKNSEQAKNYSKYSTMGKNSKDNIQIIDNHIEDIYRTVEKFIENLDISKKEFIDISKNVKAIDDTKEIAFYEKKLADLKARIENLEKEINKKMAELKAYKKDAENEINTINKCLKEVKVNKEAYDTLKAELLPKVKPIQIELEKLKQDINETEFTNYIEHRKKKLPVLVPMRDGSCGGCGVDLSVDFNNKIKDKEYAECPHCGRLIYTK